jgi:ribA/ribD-fused uncharacterized protein
VVVKIKKMVDNNSNKILFYKVKGQKYGAFSNFSPHKIEVNKKVYPTSEHYFQAMKFECTQYEEHIRTKLGNSPQAAADFGRRRDLPLRNDWEKVKDSVMETAIRAKFSQHEDLLHLLIDTGSAELVEDSPTDYYWGIGKNGTGKNMLGKILMKVRWEIASNVY